MDDRAHCVAKIRALIEAGEPTPRAILQIGYNLGRLSEITGRGREPFWDRWKDAVVAWDRDRLRDLAHRLQGDVDTLPPTAPPTSRPGAIDPRG